MPAWMLAALTTHDDVANNGAVVACHSTLAGGWIGDYLHDPGGTVLAVLTCLREWVTTQASIPALALAVGGVALVTVRRWWAHKVKRILMRLTGAT